MENSLDRWLSRGLTALFHFGALTLPLVFALKTEELFEFNKMLFVYGWASLALVIWLARMVVQRRLLLIRTAFDLPILIFLCSQLLSTLFSIHPYTSLFGYYSRFHGGLLSTVAYVVLFYVFVSTFSQTDIQTGGSNRHRPLIRWLGSAAAGLIVATGYAFPEHFGYSPSCLLATGKFSVSCWVQDVQNRVFGTFGQPNWLAAYLVLFLPVAVAAIAFLTSRWQKILVAGVVVFWYSVLLFTKSRSGLLALAIGFGVLTSWLLLARVRGWLSIKSNLISKSGAVLVSTGIVLTLLTLLIGTPLTPSIKQLFSPTEPVATTQVVGPALEVGGTESGVIRQIVWQGALNVWKRYPLFGSGLETFAYSYYQSRPVQHNLVSEWDFLYNKAHNEWLNFLATSGTVGFLAFLLLISSPFLVSIVWLWRRQPTSSTQTNIFPVVLTGGILGGLAALHVSNFFGFSTVAVTTMQFLLMGVLVLIWRQKSHSLHSVVSKPLGVTQYLFLCGFTLLMLILISKVWLIYLADVRFAAGKAHIQTGQVSLGSDEILSAIEQRPQEAIYYSTLGNYYANIAGQLAAANQASQAAVLATQADALLQSSTQLNPTHYTIYLTKIGSYLQLAPLDDAWLDTALKDVETAKTLAPTDPRPWLMEGKILAYRDQYDQALASLKNALELKPNYLEARSTRALIYELQQQPQAALEEYRYMLENLNPEDTLLRDKIASLEAQLQL